ncbi:DUF6090 family protein [Hyphomonas sp.]|uniref:DUF6090 family protein n=1 Tax=Hyphomonas sp. TaxID=87 RepID=UPI0030F9C383
MILRRVISHFRKQEWTAIGLDFLIVVVGVFIGIQVSNWNAARNDNSLRVYYLERLQSDLSETIAYLSQREKDSVEKLVAIEGFTSALNDPQIGDRQLVEAAGQYFTVGAQLMDFKTTHATFDDLSATGNLQLLENPALIEALIQLHSEYEIQNEDLLVNTDWVLMSEVELVTSFDWMRYEQSTRHLFPEKPEPVVAGELRAVTDKLRRNAALHFWFMDTLHSDYSAVITQTRSTHDKVTLELERRR